MTVGFSYGKLESRRRTDRWRPQGQLCCWPWGARRMWLLCLAHRLATSWLVPCPIWVLEQLMRVKLDLQIRHFSKTIASHWSWVERGEWRLNSCWLHSSSRSASHNLGPQAKSHHTCPHNQRSVRIRDQEGKSSSIPSTCAHEKQGCKRPHSFLFSWWLTFGATGALTPVDQGCAILLWWVIHQTSLTSAFSSPLPLGVPSWAGWLLARICFAPRSCPLGQSSETFKLTLSQAGVKTENVFYIVLPFFPTHIAQWSSSEILQCD